ncbi:MAG: hypothetical protein Q9213_004612 [Squamulea squamosa]
MEKRKYWVHFAVPTVLFDVGTEVGIIGALVEEAEEIVPILGTADGRIGTTTIIVGTAVGKIPAPAVVDGKGDAVTVDEALADPPSTMGDAVTTLKDRLRSAGTAVGIIGTKGVDDAVVVMEDVIVLVTVTFPSCCRRWSLMGDEKVEHIREVKKTERIVSVYMISVLGRDSILNGAQECSNFSWSISITIGDVQFDFRTKNMIDLLKDCLHLKQCAPQLLEKTLGVGRRESRVLQYYVSSGTDIDMATPIDSTPSDNLIQGYKYVKPLVMAIYLIPLTTSVQPVPHSRKRVMDVRMPLLAAHQNDCSLSDKDRQAIDFTQTDKKTVLADVLKAVEQKKQLCMQKRWKYTKKNGDVIVIRDLCEKMVKWVNKFKEVGDVAVQYDPSHASLPWAAVRFLLQLSINDMQIFGAMADGLEMVTCLISRCRLYEQLYLSRLSSARRDMESLLLRLYAAMLMYLAAARRYFDKSTLRRLGASVIETSESVDACVAKIAVEHDEVDRCARLIDSEVSQGTDCTVNQIQTSVDALASDFQSLTTDLSGRYQSLESIMESFEQSILRTAIQISDVHAGLKQTERREILSWLSNVKYREHHRNSYAAVMPGSGTWLQRKLEFIDWKTSSSSSILWIHGIPGSGKSKLMSTVIQSLLDDKTQNTATSAFAYFYCSRDAAETARANPDEIIRALLKQISCFDATQPVHAAVLREYRKRLRDADEDGADPSKLSLRECTDLILDITDQLPAIVMIDALDECDALRRHELLQALKIIVQKSNNLVKVMVSSRDDSDIVCRLANVPNVYIKSDDNADDVDRFVEQELDKAIDEQRLLQGCVSVSLRQLILDELRSRAHGMFLWASLQIQNLCDPERMLVASDIEDALHQLPATLSQLYSVILARIDRIAPHGRLLAMRALTWLLCAREPMQPELLIDILGATGRRLLVQEILNLCCNLVILDDAVNVFRFAHASVREFLESLPRFDPLDIGTQTAGECLHVVKDLAAPGTAFSWYAKRYWLEHYRDLDYHSRVRQSLVTEVKEFFVYGTRGEDKASWIALYASTGPPISNEISASSVHIPLLLACEYGLLEVVEAILEYQEPDLMLSEDPGSSSPLVVAASNGHSEVVMKLLLAGADPNSCNADQVTALHWATRQGSEATVLLLLQHGADVEGQDDQGWTALDLAIKENHVALVRSLILSGSDGEAMRKYGRPLIDWARTSSLRNRPDVRGILHRATGCVGIKNEGQTGYLNAILHFLYSILPFHDLLRQIPLDEDRVSVANALERLFTEMETSVEIVSTRNLTIAFGWESSQLEEPNDPFELYLVLIDFFIDYFERDDIHAQFGDSLNAAYRNLFCSQIEDLRYPRSEAAWFLTVDANGNQSFEQAFQAFWIDDDKESPRYGLLRLRLSHSPLVLVFQLRRYRYNMRARQLEKASPTCSFHDTFGPLTLAVQATLVPIEVTTAHIADWGDTEYQSHRPVHDRCTYPPHLTINLTTLDRVKYVLHGVLVHRGDFSTGGKILIYLKSHHTGRWIRCRNELVTWATEEEVFEGNFGSNTQPERLITSCTAMGLIYIQEDKAHEIARVMVPNGEQQM